MDYWKLLFEDIEKMNYQDFLRYLEISLGII